MLALIGKEIAEGLALSHSLLLRIVLLLHLRFFFYVGLQRIQLLSSPKFVLLKAKVHLAGLLARESFSKALLFIQLLLRWL